MKKTLISLICIAVILTAAVMPAGAATLDNAPNFAKDGLISAVIKGDLMGKGKPTLGSFSLLGQYLLKTKDLTDEQKQAADMNGDGNVSMADFALLGKLLLEGNSQPTIGAEDALKKAEDYLKLSGFSAEGLRKQLSYEGFNTSEIDYALANVSVDWNEQALRSGIEYLELTGFSAEGLRGQLDYEGFEQSEIDYALSNLTIDWNEQAIRTGSEYLELFPMSKQELIEQLIFDGFTQPQAEYGAQSLFN